LRYGEYQQQQKNQRAVKKFGLTIIFVAVYPARQKIASDGSANCCKRQFVQGRVES
jgi:hypothetical protein